MANAFSGRSNVRRFDTATGAEVTTATSIKGFRLVGTAAAQTAIVQDRDGVTIWHGLLTAENLVDQTFFGNHPLSVPNGYIVTTLTGVLYVYED